MKNKFLLISLFIVFAFLIRVFISINIKNIGDVLVHQEWAETLYHQSLKGSYFHPIWTYSPPTQPPLMMMAYSASHSIYENRNIFSAMHNYIKIPPASILIAFEKYGEFLTLRLWEFLATLSIALIFYFYYLKKINFKKSFLIFLLILFNPINIFLNAVWGQNDLIPNLFSLLSFTTIFSPYLILSPIIFSLGILFKPTILILLPLFSFIYLFKIRKEKIINIFLRIILPIIVILLITYLSFKPFLSTHNLVNDLAYIKNILFDRISNSSKGVNLASVSAFNIYSLFFAFDKIYGTYKVLGVNLINLGLISYIVLNLFFFIKTIKSKKITFNKSLFIIFFISQGSFLFLTNMLERYFIPALIPSIIIMVIYWKDFGKLMLAQQLIWFLNLIYAFYYRKFGFINDLFRGNSFLLTRILSLSNIFLYFLIFKRYNSLKEKIK